MKGKEALSAARRRNTALEDELAAAKAKLVEQQASAQRVEQGLRTELQVLRGQLAREVRALADGRVEFKVNELIARHRAELEKREKRLLDACHFLATAPGFRTEPAELQRFAAKLGVPMAELMPQADRDDREIRRMRQVPPTSRHDSDKPYLQSPKAHLMDDAETATG